MAALASFLAMLSLTVASWAAPFELTSTRKVRLSAPALDAAVSPDGRFTFVLQAGGVIEVLDSGGAAVQTLRAEGDFESIAIGPTGTVLILTGSRRNEATLLSLKTMVQIDTKGSPARGPETAPVTIAVYSDFQ